MGSWFTASPSLQPEESPRSTAQGEFQVHAGFGMPELFFSYNFLLIFPQFNEPGQSEAVGIMQAVAHHNQSVNATHCLHLSFPCLCSTQEMLIASRSKTEERSSSNFFHKWPCNKCIHVLEVIGKTSNQRKMAQKVLSSPTDALFPSPASFRCQNTVLSSIVPMLLRIRV